MAPDLVSSPPPPTSSLSPAPLPPSPPGFHPRLALLGTLRWRPRPLPRLGPILRPAASCLGGAAQPSRRTHHRLEPHGGSHGLLPQKPGCPALVLDRGSGPPGSLCPSPSGQGPEPRAPGCPPSWSPGVCGWRRRPCWAEGKKNHHPQSLMLVPLFQPSPTLHSQPALQPPFLRALGASSQGEGSAETI